MPSPRTSSRIAAAIGSLFCLIPTASLLAQAVLEEIVVTALKRAESLQDAPATVTAFDANLIEEARILTMRDYVNLTSNMTLMETQNNAFAFVNIRGLAQIRNVDPTVAVVVDGVLSTTGLAFSQDLYDIQQIEVLKGPQGALYGRNASGGAINITTKQPTNELEAYVRGGFGNGDSTSLSAVASGPLAEDTLLGRIVVGYKDADGWRDNVATDVKADPYENLFVSGKLLWNIGADTTVDLRLAYTDTESTGSQFVSNAPTFVTGFPGNAQFPGNGSAPPVPGLPASITALVGNPNNTSIKHQGNEPGMDDRETVTFSAKIDWETDFGTVTSLTSYDDLDHVTAAEQFAYYPFVTVAGTAGAGSHPAGVTVPAFAAALDDFGTGQNLTFGQNRFHEAISQEVRITSPDDQRLRWIAGGYYVQTDLDVMISINNDFGTGFVEQRTDPNIGGINPTVTWSQRFLAPLIPIVGFPAALALNPNTNPNALAYNFDSNHNTAYALFGQINYDLSDTLELSAALRYDRDERELTIRALDQYLPVFAFPSGRQGDVRQADFDSVQPKLTLSWQPAENLTVYGTYAEGFRSGGFNLSGVAAGVQTLTTAGVPGLPRGVQDSYAQEDTKGLELGFKATWLEGELRFDSALFYTEVDNGFTFVFVAPFTAQTTRNIKAADIQGAEASLSWLATERLQLDVGVGVLDSKITDSDWIGAGGINIIGKKMPQNPDSTFNLGLSYHRQFGNNLEWFTRLDYRRLGDVFWEPENFVARDPLGLTNLGAGIKSANGWELTAWINNASDEDWINEESNPNGIVYYGKPRQYGVELTYRF
ncbi:MAG TPA: TonB-dependent receptor [Gammaproteobacteria bacterium]|nr:TonB-dependent receptor [Gammaproteobacteria bacterium]